MRKRVKKSQAILTLPDGFYLDWYARVIVVFGVFFFFLVSVVYAAS